MRDTVTETVVFPAQRIRPIQCFGRRSDQLRGWLSTPQSFPFHSPAILRQEAKIEACAAAKLFFLRRSCQLFYKHGELGAW